MWKWWRIFTLGLVLNALDESLLYYLCRVISRATRVVFYTRSSQFWEEKRV